MTDRLPGTKFILFALLCLVAAGWTAAITGNIALDRIVPTVLPFLDDSNRYTVELEEAAGLVVGDDVRVAGVDVGRVNAIRLEQGLAVVDFEVEPHIAPTTTWKAGARWRNVIGQRFLYLYPEPGGVALPQEGVIPVSQSVPVADLAAFVGEITPLLEAIDPASQNKLTEALNDVLLGREADIQQLVVNLTDIADTVAAEEPEIRAVIANANLLLGEYNDREAQLTGFIDQLSLLANTLAGRNGELIDAANDLTRVQAELGRLISVNDDGIASSLDNLEQVTERIGNQRGSFEDSLASLRQGLASYMLVSRDGEWFNVRGVVVQVQAGGQVVVCTTETGATCAFPNDPRAPQSDPAAAATAARTGAPSVEDAVSLSPERLDAINVVTGLPLAGAAQAAADAAQVDAAQADAAQADAERVAAAGEGS